MPERLKIGDTLPHCCIGPSRSYKDSVTIIKMVDKPEGEKEQIKLVLELWDEVIKRGGEDGVGCSVVDGANLQDDEEIKDRVDQNVFYIVEY